MTEQEQVTITPKSKDFSRWYVDLIRRSDMADYTSIKGCMVIKPYGYGLWENIQALLDRRIKKAGHKNAYFPLVKHKVFFNSAPTAKRGIPSVFR